MLVESDIFKCSDIRKLIDSVPRCSGVYKVYVDDTGLKNFSDMQPMEHIFIDDKKLYLLYIGTSKDIQNRLAWHLGFFNIAHKNILNSTLSTLRFSLIASHKVLELDQQKELNDFMDEYMYIQYDCTLEANDKELKLLNTHITPLNIKNNSHPKKYQLIEQRRSKKQKYITKINYI